MSHKAWCVLGGSVLIYDALAPEGETLSEGVDGWLEGPSRTVVALGTGLIVMHLLNLLEPKHDPVHWAFGLLKVARYVG